MNKNSWPRLKFCRGGRFTACTVTHMLQTAVSNDGGRGSPVLTVRLPHSESPLLTKIPQHGEIRYMYKVKDVIINCVVFSSW